MEEMINKYRDLLTAVVVVLILCYGTYTYVFKPKINEIKNLTASLRMIDLEIRSEKGGDVLLKDPNQASALLQQAISDITKRIPSEMDVPYILHTFVTDIGKNLNVNFNLIQPGTVNDENNYRRLPIRLDFEADYGNLFALLSQLKTLPLIIRVDDLSLSKIEKSDKLSVVMNLSGFLMPGGDSRPDIAPPIIGKISDPFYAPVEKPADNAKGRPAVVVSPTGLKYSGYWIGKEFRAIINDIVVKAGDTVSGYKVIRITKDKVTVMKNKITTELPLEKKK
jgi:Tfp pilus assembly protein PilO